MGILVKGLTIFVTGLIIVMLSFGNFFNFLAEAINISLMEEMFLSSSMMQFYSQFYSFLQMYFIAYNL